MNNATLRSGHVHTGEQILQSGTSGLGSLLPQENAVEENKLNKLHNLTFVLFSLVIFSSLLSGEASSLQGL